MEFSSFFAIDDRVMFRPMYRHQRKYGIADEIKPGVIIGVRFTKDKVFYDILSEYHGKVFDEVDSVKVRSFESELKIVK